MNTENKIEIANVVVMELKAKGYDSEIMVVNKNGTECVGITVGSGSIRPNIYPDYSLSIDEIVDNIMDMYQSEINLNNEMEAQKFADDFGDYESIKKSIIPYLTKGVMPDAVSRKHLDLNVYYKVIRNDMGILILKKHLDMWNISEAEIFIQSKMNLRNQINIKDMADIIPMGIRGVMTVVTTNSSLYGSGALLLPEIFEPLAKSNKPLVILPSSIHELIVVEDGSDPNVNMIAQIITRVNEEEVNPDEVMSDHPYIYMKGEIK